VESGLFKGLQRKKQKFVHFQLAWQVVVKRLLALGALLHALPVAADALPRSKGFDQPKVYAGFWF
jgi:hypothetical protein